MKIVAIYIFKGFLKFIYFFLKLLPTNKSKILFMSRQSDSITLDFQLIKDEIRKRNKSVKMIFICKRMDKGFINNVKYFFLILKQMFHLATSKVVVIDSYSIPVCILNHKKSLFVLQIWHSIGKIKKSGYQTLDTNSGRSSKIAKLMCMHKNYDKIVAGGAFFDKFYEEGFNVSKDKLLHYGLPRIDYLIQNENNIKDKILSKYKEFKDKKVVYYAPTFRSYDVDGPLDLLRAYDPSKFILIVRGHPNQKIDTTGYPVYGCLDFTNVELLCVADYVITDYSSISLEAAALNKKLLFYVYDYDRYIKDNGLNIDYLKILPQLSSKDITKLFKIIISDTYNNEVYQKFREKYLPPNLGSSTKQIVDYILTKMK